MRVTTDDYNRLADIIGPLDTADRRALYIAGDFPRSDAVKDLDKRYRWDLFWLAVRNGHSLPDSTHGYNDDHIDTALRRIVPALGSAT